MIGEVSRQQMSLEADNWFVLRRLEAYTGEKGLSLAAFVGGAMSLATILYLLYFHLRNQPQVIMRCPRIFSFYLTMNFVYCVYLNLMNLDYFDLRLGCQPMLMLTHAVELTATITTIGRACIFYNQVTTATEEKRSPLTNLLMDIIAWFTAPGDYFANKNIRAVGLRIAANPFQKNERIFDRDNPRTYWQRFFVWSTSGEFTRYVILSVIWFAVGICFSLMYSHVLIGDKHSTLSSTFACWTNIMLPAETPLYYSLCIIMSFQVYAVWGELDPIGLRIDIIYTLVLSILIKLLLALDCDVFKTAVFWQYISPLLYFPPAISMSILLYFTYVTPILHPETSPHNHQHAYEIIDENCEDFEEKGVCELRRAIMYMKGPSQFRLMNTKMERFWNTPHGKKKILSLGSKYYIFESLRFLGESDSMLGTTTVDLNQYEYIYETYVKANAEWELNLSYAMRQEFLEKLKKYSIGSYCSLLKRSSSSRSITFKRTNSFLVSPASFNLHSESTQQAIEELNTSIFKIRIEIFRMIDPMIQSDLIRDSTKTKKTDESDCSQRYSDVKNGSVVPFDWDTEVV